MADCRYFEELISAGLDGELTEREEDALRAHLENCESCRAYRDALRAVTGAEADLPAPPAELTGRIMDAVRREAAPKKKPKVVPIARYLRAAALAAAAALVIWAGFRVVTPKGITSASSPAAAPQAMMSVAAAGSAKAEDMPAAAPEMAYEAEETMDAAVPAENQARGSEDNGVFAAAAAPAAGTSAAVAEEAARDMGQAVLALASGETIFTGSLEEEDLRALLTADELAAAPEREPDYVLTLTAWGGTEVWYLWEEDGAVLCLRDGTDEAGRTVGVQALRDMFGIAE